jgi:hypothetical protein
MRERGEDTERIGRKGEGRGELSQEKERMRNEGGEKSRKCDNFQFKGKGGVARRNEISEEYTNRMKNKDILN